MNKELREYIETEIEELRKEIEEENARWAETERQLQQQFAVENGAHAGKIDSINKRIVKLEKKLNPDVEISEENLSQLPNDGNVDVELEVGEDE